MNKRMNRFHSLHCQVTIDKSIVCIINNKYQVSKENSETLKIQVNLGFPSKIC